MTVMDHEWSNTLPNPRKQEPYDFILRVLIEQIAGPAHRVRFRDAGFAAKWSPDKLPIISVCLVSVLQTMRRQIRRKEEIYVQGTLGH